MEFLIEVEMPCEYCLPDQETPGTLLKFPGDKKGKILCDSHAAQELDFWEKSGYDVQNLERPRG